MSRPPNIATDRNDEDDEDQTSPVPPTPTLFGSKKVHPRIQQTLETLASSVSAPQSAEPSKPKHDLKEEYKDFWTKQKEEKQRQEKVRKGDGNLRPDLVEPWERESAKENDSTPESPSGPRPEATKNAGSNDVSDNGNGAVTKSLAAFRSSSGFPLRTELNFLTQQHDILPRGKTAFEWALEPFLKDHPEYRAYLALTPSPSYSSFSLPSLGSSLDSGEVSACTDDAFPSIPLEKLTLYLRGKDEVLLRLKVLDVKTTLLRCSILYCAAYTAECNERSASSYSNKYLGGLDKMVGKEWYMDYSKAGLAAERAESLAHELGIKGLQARANYWKGKAAWGMRYWDEAAAAFRDAMQNDVFKEGGYAKRGVAAYGGNGLTPLEMKEVEWFYAESEKRNEVKQRRRAHTSLGRRDTPRSDVMEGMEEEEKELASEQEAGRVEDEYVDVVKEYPEFMEVINRMKGKYRKLPFKPFNKDELHYILHGTKEGETGDVADQLPPEQE